MSEAFTRIGIKAADIDGSTRGASFETTNGAPTWIELMVAFGDMLKAIGYSIPDSSRLEAALEEAKGDSLS